MHCLGFRFYMQCPSINYNPHVRTMVWVGVFTFLDKKTAEIEEQGLCCLNNYFICLHLPIFSTCVHLSTCICILVVCYEIKILIFGSSLDELGFYAFSSCMWYVILAWATFGQALDPGCLDRTAFCGPASSHVQHVDFLCASRDSNTTNWLHVDFFSSCHSTGANRPGS